MNETLIITQDEVRELLPMTDCIEAVRRAMIAYSTGEAVQPLRDVLWLPDRRGALGSMPAYMAPSAAMGTKVISIFPANTNTPYDAHQGVVLLFETEFGRLLAIVDATEMTAVRTAAASAVATDALARSDTTVLAILGTGAQAVSHLEAIPLVRDITQIRIWGRDRAKAEHVAAQAPRPATVAPTVADAVDGADVICTVTAATAPILTGDLVTPGAHINAVGSATPTAREVDTATIVGSRVFTDSMESALAEAGDLVIPLTEGAIDADHIIGEVGAVLAGRIPGRRSTDDITLFESLGIGVEDVAATRLVYDRAVARGAGTPIAIAGTSAP